MITPDPNAVLFWRHVHEEIDAEALALAVGSGLQHQLHDPAHITYLANMFALRWGLPGSEKWMARLKELKELGG